jgi:hypothetical protein
MGMPHQKVILEGPACHQLLSDIIDGDESLRIDGCLVVESLELWLETLDCELLMDGII